MARDDGSFRKSKTSDAENAAKGDNYLVLVAIDKYVDELKLGQLRNPIKDAERLKNVLLERYNFEDDHQKLKFFKNEEATLHNISRHLKDICKGNRENDNLIFYFAGHGNKKGIRLNRGDSDEDSLIRYDSINNEITNDGSGEGLLDDYLINKNFRHILFIFDCCHAGAFQLGKSGNTKSEYFSRYALASCAADKQAADEIIGLPGGSPFSIKFVEILEKMGKNFTIQDIKKDLTANVALATQGLQFADYKSLNFEMNGMGHFLFELRQEVQQKWKTEQIQHSILEHLGFKEQRGNVESTYKPEKNRFNVFSACAETDNTHEILRKVIFRSASRVESLLNEGAEFSLEKNPETINVGDDIWETFYRQMHKPISESEPVSQEQKKEVVDWLIGRLLEESIVEPRSALTSDSENSVQKIAAKAPKTIILQGQMSIIKDKILIWCNEFYTLFIERSEIYPVLIGGKPQDVNRIVFYFQEMRKDETKITGTLFDNKAIMEKANIVITPKAKKIGIVDIANWLKELPEAIVNAEKEKLGKEVEWKDFLSPNKELPPDGLEHSDFLKKVISFFKLSSTDEQKIFEELYNQKNENK